MKLEFSFPRLIVLPLSCHEVDGVRKEKERLTAASLNGLDWKRKQTVSPKPRRKIRFKEENERE